MRVLSTIVALALVGAAVLMGLRPGMSTPPPTLVPRTVTRVTVPPPPRKALPPEIERLLTDLPLGLPERGVLEPGAIVLHSTSGLLFARAIDEMKKRGWSLHVLIDADGKAHRLVPLDRQARAARAMDDIALHIGVAGGVGSELLLNRPQFEAAADLVGLLAKHFRIFKSNSNVIERAGIFSHSQVKYRFGGLKRGEAEGRWEPGEEFVEEVLKRIGGTWFPEEKWHARMADGWCVLPRTARASATASKGRDLTPRAKVELASCESEDGLQPASFRMKYVNRGKMAEIRGIVLHFTYTETLSDAVEKGWERDGFGPHLVVDTDGKAYQLVDALDEQVAAAAGTNETCLQVEIVGLGQAPLLANAAQLAKVVEVVKELAQKFRVPLTNEEIDERRGVFSHGQAKKRWGRSRTMTGKDFDPGEEYMKKVLEGAGGTYVPEAKWKGRTDGEWAVEYEDWIP